MATSSAPAALTGDSDEVHVHAPTSEPTSHSSQEDIMATGASSSCTTPIRPLTESPQPDLGATFTHPYVKATETSDNPSEDAKLETIPNVLPTGSSTLSSFDDRDALDPDDLDSTDSHASAGLKYKASKGKSRALPDLHETQEETALYPLGDEESEHESFTLIQPVLLTQAMQEAHIREQAAKLANSIKISLARCTKAKHDAEALHEAIAELRLDPLNRGFTKNGHHCKVVSKMQAQTGNYHAMYHLSGGFRGGRGGGGIPGRGGYNIMPNYGTTFNPTWAYPAPPPPPAGLAQTVGLIATNVGPGLLGQGLFGQGLTAAEQQAYMDYMGGTGTFPQPGQAAAMNAALRGGFGARGRGGGRGRGLGGRGGGGGGL